MRRKARFRSSGGDVASEKGQWGRGEGGTEVARLSLRGV